MVKFVTTNDRPQRLDAECSFNYIDSRIFISIKSYPTDSHFQNLNREIENNFVFGCNFIISSFNGNDFSARKKSDLRRFLDISDKEMNNYLKNKRKTLNAIYIPYSSESGSLIVTGAIVVGIYNFLKEYKNLKEGAIEFFGDLKDVYAGIARIIGGEKLNDRDRILKRRMPNFDTQTNKISNNDINNGIAGNQGAQNLFGNKKNKIKEEDDNNDGNNFLNSLKGLK